jgi:hypothetical protein
MLNSLAALVVGEPHTHGVGVRGGRRADHALGGADQPVLAGRLRGALRLRGRRRAPSGDFATVSDAAARSCPEAGGVPVAAPSGRRRGRAVGNLRRRRGTTMPVRGRAGAVSGPAVAAAGARA